MTKEIWRDYNGSIKEFHGLIRVSNLGRIYKIGTNTSLNHNRILKATKSSAGYMRIHISINGKVFNKAVHRLVAETWCPNPKHKPFVDHINAIRTDNRASNLRWVTTAENNSNPHYLKELSKRNKRLLKENNWLTQANLKPCYAEHKDGTRIYFKSEKEINKQFQTKANLHRLFRHGKFVTSKRSKLYGWRLRYVHEKDIKDNVNRRQQYGADRIDPQNYQNVKRVKLINQQTGKILHFPTEKACIKYFGGHDHSLSSLIALHRTITNKRSKFYGWKIEYEN